MIIKWKIKRFICKIKGHDYGGEFSYNLQNRNGEFKRCKRCLRSIPFKSKVISF